MNQAKNKKIPAPESGRVADENDRMNQGARDVETQAR